MITGLDSPRFELSRSPIPLLVHDHCRGQIPAIGGNNDPQKQRKQ